MELPIQVRMNGDRESCVKVRTELENILQGSELRYSQFVVSHKFGFYIAYIIGIPALIFVALLIVHQLFGLEMVHDDKISIWILVEWVVICAAFFGLKKKMFPKMMFDIGRSTKVSESAIFWRNLVGIGVGVGLTMAVLGGLIVERVLK